MADPTRVAALLAAKPPVPKTPVVEDDNDAAASPSDGSLPQPTEEELQELQREVRPV